MSKEKLSMPGRREKVDWASRQRQSHSYENPSASRGHIPDAGAAENTSAHKGRFSWARARRPVWLDQLQPTALR
jgi:hypothetical protein